METWRPVVGFPGYEVSSLGRARSHKRGRTKILSLRMGPVGYLRFVVYLNGRRFFRSVHSEVATAFHGPRPPDLVCRHLDGDATNNQADNLTWGTQSENQRDSVRHGTHKCSGLTKCPNGHDYDPANTYVTPQGHRRCRTCLRAKDAAYLERRRERAA